MHSLREADSVKFALWKPASDSLSIWSPQKKKEDTTFQSETKIPHFRSFIYPSVLHFFFWCIFSSILFFYLKKHLFCRDNNNKTKKKRFYSVRPHGPLGCNCRNGLGSVNSRSSGFNLWVTPSVCCSWLSPRHCQTIGGLDPDFHRRCLHKRLYSPKAAHDHHAHGTCKNFTC